MLSNTCKYAIRSVIYISIFGKENKKIGIKEISAKLDIPMPFLGKILQTLVKHNLLVSTKGPKGGFGMGRPAEDISLMDIIELIDGVAIFDICLVRNCSCSDEEPCGLHDNITVVRKEMRAIFENQTISDLASEFKRDSGRVQI